MKLSVVFAAAALAIAAPLAVSHPAAAQGLSVTVSPGIAFGYTDGYWDTNHHWHAWHNRAQMESWHRAHAQHFYAMRHDRAQNAGWRNQNWWARH